MTQRKLERFCIEEKSKDAKVKGPWGRYTEGFYVTIHRLFLVYSDQS